MRARRFFAFVALAVGCGCMGSCNAVLGYDEAVLDPNLAGTSTPSCERYCALATANCSGDNLLYITPNVCLSMCSVVDLGTLADRATNSTGCRQFYADAAARDPAANCPAAGPLGGKVCGEPCVAFCATDLDYCQAVAYPDNAACEAACAKFKYDPKLRINGDQDRDTFNCRAYHLQAAEVNVKAKVVHCPHTNVRNAVCAGAAP